MEPRPEPGRPAAPAAPEGGRAPRPGRDVLSRARAVLRREWRDVGVAAWRELRARGVAGVALALVGTLAMIVLHGLEQMPEPDRVVRALGEVRADQPLWQSLLRTPLSVFIPTREQPPWGGIPRLVLAFGLGQLLIGWRRTLLVAYGATLAGTLGARAMVAIGPGHWAGVPESYAHAVDTGASAAVVGLFTYLAIRLRAPVLCLVFVVPTVIGSLLNPNLAGREHLVAVALVAATAAALHRRGPSAGAPRGAQDRGGDQEGRGQ
ncbi:hypothetical protein [Streptomyces spectabilis]|uniref:hypothetical protein n=1 Tax=Streptomyces spectabilis TaxID=68270 RepID=UPI001376AA63|nr:hypothetical protein [Streptomyces spectabilis]